MNKEQLQELYNAYIDQANHCFEYATDPAIVLARLSGEWEFRSQAYELAAQMLMDKCSDNDIIIGHKFSQRQKEINRDNREEMQSSLAGENYEKEENE